MKKIKPINYTEFDVIEKFDSLNELSMAVGYKNPNYFAKKVKEQLGVELKFPWNITKLYT